MQKHGRKDHISWVIVFGIVESRECRGMVGMSLFPQLGRNN